MRLIQNSTWEFFLIQQSLSYLSFQLECYTSKEAQNFLEFDCGRDGWQASLGQQVNTQFPVSSLGTFLITVMTGNIHSIFTVCQATMLSVLCVFHPPDKSLREENGTVITSIFQMLKSNLLILEQLNGRTGIGVPDIQHDLTIHQLVLAISSCQVVRNHLSQETTACWEAPAALMYTFPYWSS